MKPIERDKERFAKLAPDKPSGIPRDYSAPLDFKPTRTLIRERTECRCDTFNQFLCPNHE